MHYWNYRLVLRRRGKDKTYAIHEAHYNDHGHVWSISMEPDAVSGETKGEARRAYEQQAEAFTKPILDYDKIGKPTCKRCLAEQAEVKRQIGNARVFNPVGKP